MIAYCSLVLGESLARDFRRLNSRREKRNTFPFHNFSFTSKNSFRKFPLLTGLHRVTDGALVGVLFAVGIMSTVALHSQHLWTVSFSKLEVTRGLTQRLLESTAVLENYLLKTSSIPEYMETTKAKDLIYLNYPEEIFPEVNKDSSKLRFWKRLASYPIGQGY